MEKEKKSSSFINARSFVAALVIIAICMVVCYIATLIIPCEGIPFWKWLLSPILVLGSEDRVTLLGVILFLLIIGGTFNALTDCGTLLYLIRKIVDKYGSKKYTLMGIIIFFFMAMASLIGCFEEVVPIVPVIVTLAIQLGWDALTGLCMSLLAAGCGFAAGVFNPFSVGVAQELAGLPLFSGAWFRAIAFVLIFLLLYAFTRRYAQKIDRGTQTEGMQEFVRDEQKEKGAKAFAIVMLLGILTVLSTAVLTFLRDYSFVIISVMFLIAGILGCRLSGMDAKTFWKSFGNGAVSVLPAVLMILMAASIKYTLQTAGALDYMIEKAIEMASGMPRWAVILFIYLIALVLNFFIASGSAKAVILIPLLVPLAAHFNISSQLVVVAYAFGDGFSNVFYPTNPVLLISLGLADTSYGEWAKHTVSFQIVNLVLTSLLLLFGLAIGLS